jgi:hypothetical protein
MTEKVIFELRREQSEDGIRYKVRRGDGDFKVLKPHKRGFHPPMLFCPMPWMKMPWHSRRLRNKSRRRMRATLDFYEQMYADLYGEPEEGISTDKD